MFIFLTVHPLKQAKKLHLFFLPMLTNWHSSSSVAAFSHQSNWLEEHTVEILAGLILLCRSLALGEGWENLTW